MERRKFLLGLIGGGVAVATAATLGSSPAQALTVPARPEGPTPEPVDPSVEQALDEVNTDYSQYVVVRRRYYRPRRVYVVRRYYRPRVYYRPRRVYVVRRRYW
jgi:hypothetical protein